MKNVIIVIVLNVKKINFIKSILYYMPYIYRKVPNKQLYIVKLKDTGEVLGRTKDPVKMIRAIEISKHKKNKV